MADDNDRSVQSYFNQVRVGNLPYGIGANDVVTFFERFGPVKKKYMKYRISRESEVMLSHPYAFILFTNSESVDQVMATRPHFIGDCQLFVRRCLPITPKYPNEPFISTRKILLHTKSGDPNEILPDNETIMQYLSATGGKIQYFQRINDKTVLVQFGDYDPVDLCCLLRPHFIDKQPIEIEKYSDEKQVHALIQLQEQSNYVSGEVNSEAVQNSPLTSNLTIEDEIKELQLAHEDVTNHLAIQHQEVVAKLLSELEQTTKERIRLERLTLDYQQEKERLEKENRQWQKSFADSLREKPDVQNEGERGLEEATRKTQLAAEKYNQLIKNIQ